MWLGLCSLVENSSGDSCDGSFLQSSREQIMRFPQTEVILCVHIIGMELSPTHLPDEAIHISRLDHLFYLLAVLKYLFPYCLDVLE